MFCIILPSVVVGDADGDCPGDDPEEHNHIDCVSDPTEDCTLTQEDCGDITMYRRCDPGGGLVFDEITSSLGWVVCVGETNIELTASGSDADYKYEQTATQSLNETDCACEPNDDWTDTDSEPQDVEGNFSAEWTLEDNLTDSDVDDALSITITANDNSGNYDVEAKLVDTGGDESECDEGSYIDDDSESITETMTVFKPTGISINKGKRHSSASSVGHEVYLNVVGDNATVTVQTSPANALSGGYDGNCWSFTGGTEGSNPGERNLALSSAGSTEFNASCSEDSASAQTLTNITVEVSSLETENEGELIEPNEGEENGGDGESDDDSVLYVASLRDSDSDANIDVIAATLNPATTTPGNEEIMPEDLPEGEWSFTGGEDGDDDLHRELSLTTSGEYTFTATCGNSEKTLIYKVIEIDTLEPEEGIEVANYAATFGDDDEPVRLFVICPDPEEENTSANIIATPKPVVPQEELPSDWTWEEGGPASEEQLFDSLMINTGEYLRADLKCGVSRKVTDVVIPKFTVLNEEDENYLRNRLFLDVTPKVTDDEETHPLLEGAYKLTWTDGNYVRIFNSPTGEDGEIEQEEQIAVCASEFPMVLWVEYSKCKEIDYKVKLIYEIDIQEDTTSTCEMDSDSIQLAKLNIFVNAGESSSAIPGTENGTSININGEVVGSGSPSYPDISSNISSGAVLALNHPLADSGNISTDPNAVSAKIYPRYEDKGRIFLRRNNNKIRLWKRLPSGLWVAATSFLQDLDAGESISPIKIEGIQASGFLKDTKLIVSQYVEYDDGESEYCKNEVPITVVRANVEGLFSGNKINEHNELFPGLFVRLNNDDDDGSGIADWDDESSVSKEDDLVSFNITTLPGGVAAGSIKYNVHGRIVFPWTFLRVWEDARRSRQVSSENELGEPLAMPVNLTRWLEGYQYPAHIPARAIAIYTAPAGGTHKDQLNITPMLVNIHLFDHDHSNHLVLYHDEEELYEENIPYAFIDLNNKDIDGDGTPDNENDTLEQNSQGEFLYDNLIVGNLHLNQLHSDPGLGLPPGIVLLKKTGIGQVRVFWKTQSGEHGAAQQILGPDDSQTDNLWAMMRPRKFGENETTGGTVDFIDDGMVIAIEGVQCGDVTLELSYIHPATGQTINDKTNITVSHIDLDIDSDNNNGFDLPDLSNEEDQIEDIQDDPENPGKLIFVNNSDPDMDTVPGFADGINKFDNEGANAAARFTPVVITLPESVDISKAKFKITYNESDPSEITRTGDDPSEYKYKLPPHAPNIAGRMRVWTKDGIESRRVEKITSQGDFIPSNEVFSFTDLPGETIIETNQWRLYVEAVTHSLNVGDAKINISVSPHGDDDYVFTDSIHLTAYASSIVEITGPNEYVKVQSPKPSMNAPKLTIRSYNVTNIRASEDGEKILGDIHVAGTVESTTCDLTPDPKGRIESLPIFINNAQESFAFVNVNVSKQVDESNWARPYAYHGTFNQTIAEVELQPGANIFRLAAIDPVFLNATFAEFSAGVDIDYPDPVSFNKATIALLSVSFPQDKTFEQIDETTPVTVTATVGANTFNGTFYQSADNPLLFTDGKAWVYFQDQSALEQSLLDTQQGLNTAYVWIPTLLPGVIEMPLKESAVDSSLLANHLVNLRVDLRGGLSGTEQDVIEARVRLNDGSWRTVELIETAVDSKQFEEVSLVAAGMRTFSSITQPNSVTVEPMSVTLADAPSVGGTGMMQVTVTDGQTGLSQESFYLEETASGSGEYNNDSSVTEDTAPPSYVDSELTSGPLSQSVVQVTAPGWSQTYATLIQGSQLSMDGTGNLVLEVDYLQDVDGQPQDPVLITPVQSMIRVMEDYIDNAPMKEQSNEKTCKNRNQQS